MKQILAARAEFDDNRKVGEIDRDALWAYCRRAAPQSRVRAKIAKVPHAIDANYLDDLLAAQKWKCAVSGLAFDSSKPFGPSLDRIKPRLGYVPGNLRIVCHIVNVAMNEWGLQNLRKLMIAMVCNDDKLALTIINELELEKAQ